ncbi:uracil-xanthine permease family protein [Desulfovibrio gilichinskyi]|uniref:Nucleobase:cation symporter-2, NCS2 family/xanthine permease XanP n=1 Tax=Desulfovibrio gilichinskyi TaxID=1519643 RepID=A0A1X7CTE1_9BACT|nr:solute carrier family 23 protein [Desulfovibrio gilichinskyi]SMF02873.1 nucleobase:cation symporter-2, NCS2 family/xanthine permease XanP [Desulfovibrio gilichinskyi]
MADNKSKISTSPYFHLITAVLSLQHIIIVFVGIMIVPAMVAQLYRLSPEETHYLIFMTTLGAGISTLLQPYKFKQFGLGMPMYMGTSGAFMACASASLNLGGLSLFSTLSLMSAPFQILFSYGIRFMRHILTPTVGGVIIMLAIAGLLKDSVNIWIEAGSAGQAGLLNVMIGMITILIMILVEWFGKEKLRPWGLFMGLTAGIIVEALIGGVDFSSVQNAPWIGLPPMHWPEFCFDITNLGHWTAYFTFIVSVQVASIKYVGDAMALQRVVNPGQKRTDFDAIQGGLYSSSVGMAVTSILGGMPSTSHSANIPLMEMTGIASRKVAVVAALMLMAVIFSPKTAYLFDSIPGEVIGAVGVVLVAHLFATGVRILATELDYRNAVIAGLSLCFGIIAENNSFYPDAFPLFLQPLTTNGFAVGGLIAVGLTILTRFSVKHSILFFVKPVAEEIVTIRNKVSSFSAQSGMSLKSSNYLEIACEEIFVHALSELEQAQNQGMVRYKMHMLDNKIKVEISFGARLNSDVGHVSESACSVYKMSEEELKSLGLILLTKIVNDITHQDMGHYTYICFNVPLK